MNRALLSLILFGASFCAPVSASTVTIDWVTIGGPPNQMDTVDGDYAVPGIQNFGAVDYTYRIGKYDVTNSQYVAFLNSNDPTGANPLGLYNSVSGTFGGINYSSGAAAGSKYSVISGKGNNPVNYVSFYDALRFANWLDNGQTPGSTETGAYTLLGGTPTPTNGNSITRNAGARVVLPSENEWYKAAYYNPSTSSYFQYPTSSNTAPTATTPTSNPNSANYDRVVGNLTAVGAYSGTMSPYGAYDMGGNVWQWNEALIGGALIGGSYRGVRGGSLYDDSSGFQSLYRFFNIPTTEFDIIGFRVASVPEPSTGVMAVIGCCLLGLLRKRFKRA